MKDRLIKFLWFLIGVRKETKDPYYKPTVTVMIPAYNEELVIGDTIKSVFQQTYPPDRILVIDDCSSDRTGEIARELGVEVIRTSRNTGTKSGAQNFGLQFVDTEVLITLDADTILHPRAIERIVPALSDGKTLSACGFVIPQRVKTFWEIARLLQYLYYIGLNKGAQNHLGIPLVSSGCFSAFNVRMLKEMGGFPEGTIVEDMALTWQAHLERKRVKLVPEAICYPKDPSNWRQYKAQVSRWYRGFLQCVSAFKWRLFKRPILAIFVFWYLLSSIINIVFLWGIVFLFTRKGAFGVYAAVFLAAEVIIWLIIVVVNGIRYGNLKKVIVGIPIYWLETPVENYLFACSLFREWILGEKLSRWEKGH